MALKRNLLLVLQDCKMLLMLASQITHVFFKPLKSLWSTLLCLQLKDIKFFWISLLKVFSFTQSTNTLKKTVLRKNFTNSTKNKIIEIKNYLKSNKFKHTFLSDFKKNILDTLDYFETLEQIYLLDEDKGGFQKETQTLYWSSSSNTTRTAVLFIPGWSDCAEAGQGLAPYVQEAGMDMFSFDLWGHGKDDQRPELCNRDNTSSKRLSFKKPPADILAIHLRAFINYITSLQQYDNIVIVAHSLGASLTINNYLSTIENNPKIKGTILLPPAIVQHILSLLNPDRMEHPSAPTGRYFSSEPLPLGEQKQKTDKMP